MHIQSNSSRGFCYTCPNRHFRFCMSLLNIPSTQFYAYSVRNKVFTAKQYLYHQGEMSQDLYVLREGWVMLSRLSRNGDRQVFRSILPGEVLGYQQHLKGPATYSAIAILDSVVCRVPNMERLYSTQPGLALSLASAGAYDIMLTEMYLTNVTHRSARERIAFMVLEIYHRLRLRHLNKGYSIQFPLKQEDIADTLGLTVIHVNRTLHVLRVEGFMELNKHELTILNYDGLCSLVDSEFETLAPH